MIDPKSHESTHKTAPIWGGLAVREFVHDNRRRRNNFKKKVAASKQGGSPINLVVCLARSAGNGFTPCPSVLLCQVRGIELKTRQSATNKKNQINYFLEVASGSMSDPVLTSPSLRRESKIPQAYTIASKART